MATPCLISPWPGSAGNESNNQEKTVEITLAVMAPLVWASILSPVWSMGTVNTMCVALPMPTALAKANRATIVAAMPHTTLAGAKLTYFGIPGRGEALRLALAIGGVEFEDKRVPFPAWGKVKPTTPWGTLPVLELADGSQLAQARSILRYIGRHTGLYPADPLAAQRVDELMDALEDLAATITSVGQGLPKEEQEAARLTAVSEGGAIYDALANIDAFIEANGQGGYAIGSEMNIASILMFTTLGRLVGGVFYGVPPTVIDPFPNIMAVRKTVGSNSAVAEWYSARIEQISLTSLSPAEQVLVSWAETTCDD
jgi:prostaglandin-H2 D-isomerase / glutathione transferase